MEKKYKGHGKGDTMSECYKGTVDWNDKPVWNSKIDRFVFYGKCFECGKRVYEILLATDELYDAGTDEGIE